jgi:hypothetical protein
MRWLTEIALESNVVTMDRAQESVSELLAELVADMRAALGDDLVAVYLYGSSVTGGFDVGVSDVDLVTITRRNPPTLELAALGAMHAAFTGRHPAWTDRIEAVYVGLDALALFRTSAGRLAVISPGEPLHLRKDRPATWIQNWYFVKATGVALFGPPARELLPHVGWVELVDATKQYVTEVAAKNLGESSAGHLAYAVLTVCRAEQTVVDGTLASKQEAASWSSRRHPEWAWLIESALRCRLTKGSIGFDDEATRAAAVAFVRSIAGEVGSMPSDSHAEPSGVRGSRYRP